MLNRQKAITLEELNKVARNLKEGWIELISFKLNSKIDLVQLNQEFEAYQKKNQEVLTFIEYVKEKYMDAVNLILKIDDVKDCCFDEFLNINEDLFFVRNSKNHVVTQAQNFVYFILKV